MNYFTWSGKRRWGILPVYHMRLAFRTGHTETLRLYSYAFQNGGFAWVRAPGQHGFRFSVEDVVSYHVIKKTWRLGIADLLQSSWRKGVR